MPFCSLILGAAIFILSQSAHAILITEIYLKEQALKSSPTLTEIESALLSSELNESQKLEDYSPEVYGKTSYAETNERPLIPFIPIFSPVKDARVGLRQKLKNGFSFDSFASTRQHSAVSPGGKYRDVTISAVNFTVQMDLWKDVLGRLSKANLENFENIRKRSELEQKIQSKAFLISLRRTYWALVANNEALKISQSLLDVARTQTSDTVRRFKNSVAETDEVARYKAQLASREGTIASLEYQKRSLIKQLRNLIPELANSEIELQTYDLKKTLDAVLQCTGLIASRNKVPLDFTYYDEVTRLLRDSRKNYKTINERYSDPDVNLYARATAVGVASDQKPFGFQGSYGGSFDDMTSNNRTGYEVGVNVVIPLGDQKGTSEKIKSLYDEKRLSAVVDKTEAQVVNTHMELISSIDLLHEVVRSQKESTQELTVRLKYMKKKYEQARASVNDVVLDQDALLNSQLATLEAQLLILNVLFDYLAIYTETPCEFNRI